jgi:hypothetical protein
MTLFSSETGQSWLQDGAIGGLLLAEKRFYLFYTASKYSILSAVCLTLISWGKMAGASSFHPLPSSAKNEEILEL